MIKQICVNLPVANVSRSLTFYSALGFKQNSDFSDNTAAMVTINDAISVMLTSHEKFQEFTPKEICDTSKSVEALFNLRCENRCDVDKLVATAVSAGGSTYDKAEDFGFMYTHSFVDPDGHGWGLFHLTENPE